jgi:hypothetical protein
VKKSHFVNQKIPLLDDEPAALHGYKKMLQSEFDVLADASGEEGLGKPSQRRLPAQFCG